MKRAKHHKEQIDNILDNGLDAHMLDQLSAEDLTDILIKFNQMRMIENPLSRLAG